jgi:mono/diheme cytochrome c family protein
VSQLTSKLRAAVRARPFAVGSGVLAGWLGLCAGAAAQAVDQATLAREGQPLFARNCAVCHGANGEGLAGPRLVGRDFLKSSVAVVVQILEGYEARGMPPFKAQFNDRQVAAIGTYVRNAWGNSFGIVLPDEVKNSR